MRKIPRNLENPIDNVLIDISDKMSNFHKSLNFTPNTLTTFSLLFGLLSGAFFYKNYKILASLLFFISYFYDCADGFYARKYKMVSKFGDYYDHIVDMTKMTLIVSLMLYKDANKFLTIFPILLIIGFIMLMHMGCQEEMYSEEHECASLSLLKKICTHDPENTMKITKYFTCGTFVIIFCFVIATY